MKIIHFLRILPLLGFTVCAYAAEYCPAVDAIQYDIQTSEFKNTTGDISWTSAVTPVSDPIPALTFLMAVANGSVNKAIVSCAYTDGNNNFMMKTTDKTFTIDPKQWIEGIEKLYYCQKSIRACSFFLNTAAEKNKT